MAVAAAVASASSSYTNVRCRIQEPIHEMQCLEKKKKEEQQATEGFRRGTSGRRVAGPGVGTNGEATPLALSLTEDCESHFPTGDPFHPPSVFVDRLSPPRFAYVLYELLQDLACQLLVNSVLTVPAAAVRGRLSTGNIMSNVNVRAV
ncbi:hypothetical protein LX32DRAFT_655647 [Colletotrichum zoysiae]|uniref:Uncharacterized protein n=1 Tax=Colletotrichum zoysiae TaxID=1216348 RepID=A0AAD9HC13_9PEZI|nr:hypothetical protein LX32DRAFT_655647 [Colletotrichum zoysiae]